MLAEPKPAKGDGVSAGFSADLFSVEVEPKPAKGEGEGFSVAFSVDFSVAVSCVGFELKPPKGDGDSAGFSVDISCAGLAPKPAKVDLEVEGVPKPPKGEDFSSDAVGLEVPKVLALAGVVEPNENAAADFSVDLSGSVDALPNPANEGLSSLDLAGVLNPNPVKVEGFFSDPNEKPEGIFSVEPNELNTGVSTFFSLLSESISPPVSNSTDVTCD